MFLSSRIYDLFVISWDLNLLDRLLVFFCRNESITLQLLEDTGFLRSKPSSLPMDPNLKLSMTDGTLLADLTVYRLLIGCLLYLMISRPDITYVVHKLSQSLSQPRSSHLNVVHSLLRYLKGCPTRGILLQPTSSFQIKVFSDADWA